MANTFDITTLIRVMAALAGFARSYYSDVERRARNISAVNLIQLAKALGAEVGDLFPSSNKL